MMRKEMWRKISIGKEIHTVWIQPICSVNIRPTKKKYAEIWIKGRRGIEKGKLEIERSGNKLEIFFYMDPAEARRVKPRLSIKLPQIQNLYIYGGWGPIQNRVFQIGRNIVRERLYVSTEYREEVVICMAKVPKISIRSNNVKLKYSKRTN